MAHIDRAPLKSPQYRMETTNTEGAPLQFHFFVYRHGLWFFNAFHEKRRRFSPFTFFIIIILFMPAHGASPL